MAFPTNPTNGQTTTINGVSYTYSTALTAWTVTSSGGNIAAASSIVTGSGSGGNVTGANLVSATNVTATNITAGAGSGGNITGANLISATNFSGTTATFSGNITSGNLISNTNATFSKISSTTVLETVTLNASAFANPSTYDVLTQTVWYSTASASANFTLNIRGNSSVTANSTLAVGQSMTFALMVTNGATPYYPSAYQVDGSAITPKYPGGTAISAGNANSVDVYVYTLIKTAATPTYTLLASQTKFA